MSTVNSVKYLIKGAAPSMRKLINNVQSQALTRTLSTATTWSVVRKQVSVNASILAKSKQLPGVCMGHHNQSIRHMSAGKFDVINVQDEEDFKKRVLDQSSSIPVVVDFHATWCGPCKILAPRLESILSKENGKVLMAKVDIDDHPELAMEYGVRSVPTVVGIKNGEKQNQFIGVQDDDQISGFVDKLVVS